MEGRNMMLLLLPIICLFSSDIAHADGLAQALGFYNNGALVHASELANPEGNGWLKIVRGRGRRYGSSEILDLLTGVAADIHASFPAGERLQIADIAQAQGGRISGHDSHQNGLDADIIYYRMNHQEQDPNDDSGLHESFVANGKVTPNFDLERNWRLLQKLVASNELNRVFVDPVIKLALCDYAKSIHEFSEDSEALRRMRPLVNHDNHIHVRINCPANSPKCIVQDDPPLGSGCSTTNELFQENE